MPQNYTPEFKKKIVRLHLEEGCTYKSITAEYGVSKASISKWCSDFSGECQAKAITDPESKNEAELMKGNLRLRKELEEARKENLFLNHVIKKIGASSGMDVPIGHKGTEELTINAASWVIHYLFDL